MEVPRVSEVLRIQSEVEFWDEAYGKVEAELQPLQDNIFDETGFFYSLVSRRVRRRVLSVGGGVDSLAVHLANSGADVCSVDVSEVACEKTRLLASRYLLKGSLKILNSSCESLEFHNEFDMAVSKGALHHIDFEKGVTRIKDALQDGGELIATEPACGSWVLGFFQRTFPFHPQVDVTPFEIKLTPQELSFLRATFSTVDLRYFEFLSRPSVTYLISKLGAPGLIQKLKVVDSSLIGLLPYVSKLCQHVVIVAKK